MHFSIRHQIVGPFVVLVVFVGIVGTSIVMSQFTSATDAEFDANLLRAIVLANDNLTLLEADRLEQLRAAAGTVGVPEAVAAHNVEALAALLTPIVVNAQPAHVTIRVLDRQGQQLIAIAPGGTVSRTIQQSDLVAYAGEPSVQNVLAGRDDGLGDKYLFVASEPRGFALYWVGPVRGESQPLAGAVLLGEDLADVLSRIHGSQAGELILWDSTGRLLSSTLRAEITLGKEAKRDVTPQHPVRIAQTSGGHSYRLLVSDWSMRGRQLGYLAVALSADDLQTSQDQIRTMLVLLFASAALLALLVGVALARRMTRPVEGLVAAMQAVSAGDLQQRAPDGSKNEIGYLAKTFNAMTASLQRKTDELEKSYFGGLAALARAIDARDPHTFEHSARVAAIAFKIAEAMDLPMEDREDLRRSGLLHDIGKIGIPDTILTATGQLTNEQWEAVRRHPAAGDEMLKDVPFLVRSLPGIRHHHERWDGQGYPDQLKGDAIPLQARILAAADAFDAMTSDRSFRKSYSFEFAIRNLITGRGTQFDPAVVNAFESCAGAIVALLTEMRQRPAPRSGDVTWLDQAA